MTIKVRTNASQYSQLGQSLRQVRKLYLLSPVSVGRAHRHLDQLPTRNRFSWRQAIDRHVWYFQAGTCSWSSSSTSRRYLYLSTSYFRDHIHGLDFGWLLCISCAPTVRSRTEDQSGAGGMTGKIFQPWGSSSPSPALGQNHMGAGARIGFVDLTRRIWLPVLGDLAWPLGRSTT